MRFRYPFIFRIQKKTVDPPYDFDKGDPNEIYRAIYDQIRILNDHLDKANKNQTLRYRFLVGIFNGLGTVLGATIVVSLLIFLIKLFASFGWFKPIVDEVIKIIESRQKTR
jgi:hypothetical protein